LKKTLVTVVSRDEGVAPTFCDVRRIGTIRTPGKKWLTCKGVDTVGGCSIRFILSQPNQAKVKNRENHRMNSGHGLKKSLRRTFSKPCRSRGDEAQIIKIETPHVVSYSLEETWKNQSYERTQSCHPPVEAVPLGGSFSPTKKQPLRLCLTAIKNPQPSLEVKTVDLFSCKSRTAACIMAMTPGKSGLMK
jgi:hypothetical protein